MISVLILTQDIKKCKRFLFFLQNKSKKQPNDPDRLFSCCVQRSCQTEGSCFHSRLRRKRHRPLVAEPSLCHKTKVSGKGHFRRSAHPQATVRRLSLLFFRHFRFWHLEKNQSGRTALVLSDRYSASMIASIVRYVSSGSALLVIERPTTI